MGCGAGRLVATLLVVLVAAGLVRVMAAWNARKARTAGGNWEWPVVRVLVLPGVLGAVLAILSLIFGAPTGWPGFGWVLAC